MTGDVPATSKWSTSLLTNKLRLILEVWWYSFFVSRYLKPGKFYCGWHHIYIYTFVVCCLNSLTHNEDNNLLGILFRSLDQTYKISLVNSVWKKKIKLQKLWRKHVYHPWEIWILFKEALSILLYWLISLDLIMMIPSDECHRTWPMISQCWFR